MTPEPQATGGPEDAVSGSGPVGLSFDKIRRLLPHREPFILVDRVLSHEPGRRIVCLKSVSGAEPIFAMHFPTHAIYPGVLILEAMAQATLLLFLVDAVDPPDESSVSVLAAAHIRWLKPVRPGDQLTLVAEIEKRATLGALVSCTASVDGRVVAHAKLTVGKARLAA